MPETLYLRAPRLNQFNILNEVGADSRMTQAELARCCGLSVAMVNNYMKELCGAGLLVYRRKSSRTVSYHLTPGGVAEVAMIERELVSELAGLFAEAKERVRKLIATLAPGTLQQVVLYGVGPLAEVAFHVLESMGVNIVGVCSDNPSAPKRECCGRATLDTAQIRNLAPDTVIIASADKVDVNECTLSFLRERGVRFMWLDGIPQGKAVPSAYSDECEPENSPLSSELVLSDRELDGNRR